MAANATGLPAPMRNAPAPPMNGKGARMQAKRDTITATPSSVVAGLTALPPSTGAVLPLGRAAKLGGGQSCRADGVGDRSGGGGGGSEQGCGRKETGTAATAPVGEAGCKRSRDAAAAARAEEQAVRLATAQASGAVAAAAATTEQDRRHTTGGGAGNGVLGDRPAPNSAEATAAGSNAVAPAGVLSPPASEGSVHVSASATVCTGPHTETGTDSMHFNNGMPSMWMSESEGQAVAAALRPAGGSSPVTRIRAGAAVASTGDGAWSVPASFPVGAGDLEVCLCIYTMQEC